MIAQFTDLPVGEHRSWQIAVCPKCGRHGRLFGWRGGRQTYDHVIRELDVPVAGVHFEVVEWCDIPEAEAPPGAR
jgi:hypothetical protein